MPRVVDVNVPLRDDLRDKDCVGMASLGLFEKRIIGNLGAEVVRFEHCVALKTIIAIKALHIHDGIDADCVAVCAGACAVDNDLSADIVLNPLIEFWAAEFINDNFGDIYRCKINCVLESTIANKETIILGDFFHCRNFCIDKSHLAH